MAGKAHREGISLVELTEMFPDEDAARRWFEARIWPDGRRCPRCGSERTHEASHAKSPYRCTDCRAYFSVKAGTLMEASRLPLKKWVFALYLELTSLKGVSSLKLGRDIKVSQRSAWFMLHRIRAAFRSDDDPPFEGPVEFDKTFVWRAREEQALREEAPRGQGNRRQDRCRGREGQEQREGVGSGG